MKSFTKNYLVYLLTLSGVMVLLIMGCGKDDPAEQATLGTLTVSDITSSTAVVSGEVVHDGGASITEKGIVLNINPNPTLEDNDGKMSAGSGDGNFTLTLTGLTPATVYYVRAYATNSEGTAYCSQLNFTTEGELAVVTTGDVTDITHESAVSGGEVTDDGGLGVTARGVVWSYYEDPTVDDNQGMTSDGTGTGEFNSDITGLLSDQIYYVRAYATNSEGTSYGEEKSFETEREPVYDIDGNKYTTVDIGNQTWMVENLRTTKLNDESPITEVTDGADWAAQTEPAYSWYANYGEKFKDVMGALYNFYTVATGKLCPDGWRVPTDNDWQELIKILDGAEVAGGKLKSTTVHWSSPNEGATNESGFTALPGGLRFGDAEGEFDEGEFVYLNELGAWWAYLFTWDKGGRSYILSYATEFIGKTDAPLNVGMSVRCIKGDQGELPTEGTPPGYIMP